MTLLTCIFLSKSGWNWICSSIQTLVTCVRYVVFHFITIVVLRFNAQSLLTDRHCFHVFSTFEWDQVAKIRSTHVERTSCNQLSCQVWKLFVENQQRYSSLKSGNFTEICNFEYQFEYSLTALYQEFEKSIGGSIDCCHWIYCFVFRSQSRFCMQFENPWISGAQFQGLESFLFRFFFKFVIFS